MATSSKKKSTPIEPYNPFFTALNGITTLFSNALSVGIVILLLSATATMVSYIGNDEDTNMESIKGTFETIMNFSPAELAVLISVTAIIVIFAIVVGAMTHGIQSYTAMRLARGEKTNIGEAFNAVLSQFGNYILMYIWMNLKIFLWTLLLIVPGIIAYYRYAFSGVVFFDKNLRLNAAIDESKRLTKGGLITLFSTHTLFNMITLWYIDQVVWLASISELYREYAALDKAKQPKPAAHWLSWLTLAVPPLLFITFVFIAVVFVLIIGLSGGSFS